MPEITPDNLHAYVVASIETMIAHGLSSQAGTLKPDEAIVDVCFQSAAESPTKTGRIQLSIYVYRPWRESPPLLWEVVESTGWTRATAEALMVWLEDLDLPCLDDFIDVVENDPDQWWMPYAVPDMKPLWRFHPLRLAALMPWGKAVVNASKRHGIMTAESMQAVTMAFHDGLNDVRLTRPLRPRVAANPDYGRAEKYYTSVLCHTAGFFAGGKQVFEFPPALSSMFRNTDVDDIAFEHVKLPYPVVYLHFGPQADIPLGDGWFAEGAYLSEFRTETGDRYVNIVAVSGHESLARYMDVDLGFEPSYTLALGPEHQSMALAEAVDLVLSEKIANLQYEIEHEPMRAQVEESIRNGTAPPGAVCVQKRNAEQELSMLMPRHESFKKILSLAINALVYINAYPDDIDTQWPANASPSKLRELAKAKDKKQRSQILSELAKAGFTPIHLCGRRIVEEMAKQPSTATAGRQVALHWVRGHWRRQVHGPGRALRKLIWRMPLLRGSRQSDDSPDEPAGHIYLVS